MSNPINLDALERESDIYNDPYWDGSDDWVAVNRADLKHALAELRAARKVVEKARNIEKGFMDQPFGDHKDADPYDGGPAYVFNSSEPLESLRAALDEYEEATHV